VDQVILQQQLHRKEIMVVLVLMFPVLMEQVAAVGVRLLLEARQLSALMRGVTVARALLHLFLVYPLHTLVAVAVDLMLVPVQVVQAVQVAVVMVHTQAITLQTALPTQVAAAADLRQAQRLVPAVPES
jgi:hypothetical protein